MMTMMSEGAHLTRAIHAPPCDLHDGLATLLSFPPPIEAAYDSDEAADGAADAYTCDEFRMYEFKVRRCARGRSHDWTECPYAHPGEKARRRDLRRYHYSGVACPDFRKGMCRRGDACELAHGVFECWLHPSRYRTQPCKDGVACRRRVCFFAHTPDQLRVLPPSPRAAATVDSYDGSPLRRQIGKDSMLSSSPTSTLPSPASDSPPLSPSGINEVLASLRQLQISKMKSMERSWGLIGSPRGGVGGEFGSRFCSLPSTPTRAGMSGGWGGAAAEEEEPVVRVESGRALRARMFERLSKESGIEKLVSSAAPDVGWVSELLK